MASEVASSTENLYAIRRQAVVGNIGYTALKYSEILGYEEPEMEDWVKFEIEMLDSSLDTLLSEESGDIVFDYPSDKIWTGKHISLKNRLEKDPTLEDRINEVLEPNNFRKYIVSADKKAPRRCIDGRPIKGWADNDKLQRRPLGPKVAGATAHAALAQRIVEDDSIKDLVKNGLTFNDDILHTIDLYIGAGIGFGIHIDDRAKDNNTGCGAIDNIGRILAKLQSPEALQQLRALTQTILGDSFDRHVVNDVIARMLFLDAINPRYMPKEGNDPKGEYIYKKTIVDNVKEAAAEHHEPVEQLEGPHNEVALMLNSVVDTTIDTDRLSHDTDGEIQVFGWDVWEVFKEAEMLFPLVGDSDAQNKAIENRLKHVTVRTILGIATAMVLTDGSLKVGLLKPS